MVQIINYMFMYAVFSNVKLITTIKISKLMVKKSWVVYDLFCSGEKENLINIKLTQHVQKSKTLQYIVKLYWSLHAYDHNFSQFLYFSIM